MVAAVPSPKRQQVLEWPAGLWISGSSRDGRIRGFGAGDRDADIPPYLAVAGPKDGTDSPHATC